MRSEEEIRKRIEKLEKEKEILEQEKKIIEDEGGIAIGYTLQIESVKDEIKTLKWVLGEDEK